MSDRKTIEERLVCQGCRLSRLLMGLSLVPEGVLDELMARVEEEGV